MGEYLSQTGLGIQTQQGEMFTLRGYDPLQEIYHWSLIIFLLLDEMIMVSIAFVPAVDTVSFLSSQAWNIKFGIGVVLLFLLAGIASPPLMFLHYRREKRKREMLRQAALMGSNQPLAPLQPPAALAPLSLPIRLESQLSKSFVQGILIGTLLVILVLALDGVALLGISWQIPSFLGLFLYSFSGLVLAAVAGIARAIQTRVAGYYLHPSLQVDNEGMSARYGRETISIAWRDVRYFALVSSTTFSKKPGKRARSGTSEREAFEISDGENRICWLVASPFPSYNLLWFGETALSAQDYASLRQQLASLIVAKTGCSLLDFRLPKRKRK